MTRPWKAQRTGLTEGTLIYNEWLKHCNLYRKETEDVFINWLYSTSGWYDTNIKGTYFDIDVDAVRTSENYQRFLHEYTNALLNSDWFHLMLHSSYYLNGLEKQADFATTFSATNTQYWNDPAFLHAFTSEKRVLLVSSIAPLITEAHTTPEHPLIGYQTPQTHFNTGKHTNAWETLDAVTAEIEAMKDQFDCAIVSFGAYGVLLTDRIWNMGKDAATVGSGIYTLYPIAHIPEAYRPKDYKKIEGGRYWLNPT